MTAGRVFAFAHRGGRAHAPDNTLAAFRAALSAGATGLETDAWVTADGVVVLDHDGVHRVARRHHEPMSAVRRSELPAHVPTLDELYAECGTGFDLAVDVREPDVARAVVDVARSAGATARLWLVAPTLSTLPEWRRLDPDVHLAHTMTLRSRSMRTVDAARAAGAEAVNLRALWWSAAFASRVHGAGLLAFAYDAQTRWSLRRVLTIGVDGVFSDHVDRLTDAAAAGAG
jgi:glycerophosphoryl diester phosphodiesterase